MTQLTSCNSGGGVQGGGPGGGIIGGRTTTYAYNNLDELATMTDADSTQTTFGYDGNHRRTTTSYPNGVAMTTSYDNS